MDTPFVAPLCAPSQTPPPPSHPDVCPADVCHADVCHAPLRSTAAPAGDAARIAELAAELVLADEAARRHLAGELHDGLGADLAGARFALANLGTWLPADAPDACRRALALAEQALDAAMAASRCLIDAQDVPAIDAGLVGALSSWIGAYAARTGLRTSFVCAADARLPQLSAQGALTVFRVAQEALANVAKHARATAANVRIETDDTQLTLIVADDGVGLPLGGDGRGRGYGLGSMRARCEAFGGRLAARAPDSGRRGTLLCAGFTWAALTAAATTATGLSPRHRAQTRSAR